MTTLQNALRFGFFRQILRASALHAGLVLAATAMLAGCASAPAESESMIDEQVNFNDYKTFGWFNPVIASSGQEPMSLVDTHIRAAITTEMRRKGYAEALAGATGDLLLDYEAARVETVKSNPFRIGFGVGGFGSNGAASVNTSTSSVKNVTEGSLIIVAIDSKRNAEVWRSRISEELDEGATSTEVIQGVVTEVLDDLPSHSPTQ